MASGVRPPHGGTDGIDEHELRRLLVEIEHPPIKAHSQKVEVLIRRVPQAPET